MGQDESLPSPESAIVNEFALMYFESITQIANYVPKEIRQSEQFVNLWKQMCKNLGGIHELAPSGKISVSGVEEGQLFYTHFVPYLDIYPFFTIVRLQNCGFNEKQAPQIADLLHRTCRLKRFDLAGNPLGAGASVICLAASNHPCLISLTMDGCKIDDSSIPSLLLLFTSFRLQHLSFEPATFTKEGSKILCDALSHNHSLIQIRASLQLERVSSVKRNRMLAPIVLEIVTLKDPCIHGAHSSMKGRRATMEDNYVLAERFLGKRYLYAIFDGHGGAEASDFAARRIGTHLARCQNERPETAITNSFRLLNAEMRKFVTTGSTAALVYIIDGTLYAANIGDSRIVLCRGGVAHRLTIDHKAKDPHEAAEVVKRGGRIINDRVNGTLAVTRALGDYSLGNAISREPSIHVEELRPEDKFVIIGCDGVWDVMEDQKAVDIVGASISPEAAAKALRTRAYDMGSSDNISVIVIFLK